MLNLTRKKLGVFISVVEAGSFTKGACAYNISEPATISIINELEASLGARLFERAGKTRTAKLSPRGQEVYDVLVKALTVYDQMLEALNPRNEPIVPKLMIQAPYAPALSPDWLRSFISGFKGSRIKVRSAEKIEIFTAIENRDKCIAVIDGDARPRNSEYYPLCTSEIVMVASPSQAKRLAFKAGSISWRDVPKNTVLFSGISPNVVRRIYDNIREAGVINGEFTEVNCIEILHHFISELRIPALLPDIMAQSLRKNADFHVLRFPLLSIHVPLGLVFPYGQNNHFKLNISDIQQAFLPRLIGG